MEKMPFQAELERATMIATPSTTPSNVTITPAPVTDWRQGLPTLTGAGFTLRELRLEDAPALMNLLTTPEVARFISPPPSSIDGFAQFIEWTRREREAGNYVCFAVVPNGAASAVGLFQVRTLEPGFNTAEWGFAIGSPYWGRGYFLDGARLVLDFAFEVIGVHRMEARAAVANGRGNGALRKLGAVQEGVLRRAFLRHGQYHDQVLWSILADDWCFQRTDRRVRVH